jgi:acetyl-CoA carboxylase carboxyl transferase subunit beta
MPMKFPSFRSRREAAGPENMWTRCPSCEEQLFNKQLEKAMHVCPSCGHHFRLPAPVRLSQLLDEGSWAERDGGLVSVDPLGFVDQKAYPDRVAAAQLATGLRDAAVWGTGRIEGTPVAIVVMDFAFMGGSMGSVVGEKFARACERATGSGVPLVSVSASGGARMQEGILALMQLPKTICAIDELHESQSSLISVLTHPTTGGVLASFASLGDVVIAEPGALMSFAGPRVVAQTTREKLPDDFGLAESNYRFGHLDAIVPRSELRQTLAQLLRLFSRGA